MRIEGNVLHGIEEQIGEGDGVTVKIMGHRGYGQLSALQASTLCRTESLDAEHHFSQCPTRIRILLSLKCYQD